MSKTNGSETANASDGVLHVAFVLDKSGSMQAVEEAVVEGYNDYLGELRAQGGETLYSLTTFNTSFEHVCVGEPLERAPELDHRLYRPDGMTALYDAIAHTVLETDRRLQAEGRGEEKVLVVVMTDGLENSSTDYDADAIAELVRALRRAAELDVRLPRRGPREHHRRPARGRRDGLSERERDALVGRPASPPASPCTRSLTQPGRARLVRAQERTLLRGRRPVRADYREDEPAPRRHGIPPLPAVTRLGDRRRSIGASSAMPSTRPTELPRPHAIVHHPPHRS